MKTAILVCVAVVFLVPAVVVAQGTPAVSKKAEERDSRIGQLGITPSGFTGNYRVLSADSAPGGTFRVGALAEFSKATEFLVVGDSNTFFGANVVLSVTPIEHLETFLRISSRSNDNTKSSPTLIQVLGDLTWGLKGYFAPIPALSLAAAMQLRFLNATGEASYKGSATSVVFHQMTTFDMSRLASRVPLRMHLNWGGIVDNSANLLTANIQSNPATAVLRYALRIAETNRFVLAIGLDAPLPYVTPFLDWNIEIPTSPNGATGASYPHTLALGVRGHPWSDLALLMGVDIGLTSKGAIGIPAVPPWAFFFGLSYNIEPGRAKVVEKVVEKTITVVPPATTGVVIGKVTDKATGKPLEGAIVMFPARDSARLATAADGGYGSFEIAAGKIRARVMRDGYKAEEWDVTIPAGGVATLNVALAPEPVELPGGVRGRVVDEGGQVIADATAELKAPGFDTVSMKVDGASGAFSAKARGGKYTVAVAAQGFQGVERAVEFGAGEVVIIEVTLKRVVVQVAGDASIEANRIVTKEKIEFAPNTTKFAGKSTAMLDSVAKLMKGNPQIKKVRIEAHTDNKLGAKKSEKLTKKQADLVLKALVDAGVAADRLEAKGFGQAKPIVPNLTNRDREKNRRVDLIIAE